MKRFISILVAIATAISTCNAQNPIIQTNYTADPAPIVYNDRVYIYTGRDEDASSGFTMHEYRVYSSDDMVNWTDHGSVFSHKNFGWVSGDAWAAHCIERKGVGTTHNDEIMLKVRFDSLDGELLGALKVPHTGDEDRWKMRTINIYPVKRIHDLCCVVKGKAQTNLIYFDHWRFSK